MKTTRITLLALALAGAGVFAGTETRPAAAQISAGVHIGPSGHARVDLGFFYDDLASYGSWVERPSYGWVWSPRVTRANWRPYQYGHWAWTDYGWTWISDEPFGWATYHYGRWYDDPNYGWEWVPGNEWAPSYVSWQEGDDYIGWAPLPPSVSIRTGFLNVSLAPAAYLFVPEGRFLDTRVYDYAVPRRDCERIYRQTRNFTNYRYEGNRVFAAGVPVDRVQRVIGRNVPRYQVADQGWNQRHQNRFSGNRVAMFRPQVERGRVAPPSARPLARNSVVSSNQARQGRQLRQEVAGQGRLNRQQQQIARQQLQTQGRLNRQQQQIARRQLQDQGRINRQQQARQQQTLIGRQAQNQARNHGRWQQQQVQRQERQVQNQERFNRQQQARIERQTQNQARNQEHRQQQQVQRQERQVQNQERFNRQQQARVERQAQNQARNQGRWQQQQAQRQERQMARQQNAAPRGQGRQQQQQARPQQQRPQRQMNENRGGGRGNGGGGRPQGNNRGNRHGRDGNG